MEAKKKLYLAICKGESGNIYFDQNFYESDEDAIDWLEDSFVQLWTNGPSFNIRADYKNPKKPDYLKKDYVPPPEAQMEFSKFLGATVASVVD